MINLKTKQIFFLDEHIDEMQFFIYQVFLKYFILYIIFFPSNYCWYFTSFVKPSEINKTVILMMWTITWLVMIFHIYFLTDVQLFLHISVMNWKLKAGYLIVIMSYIIFFTSYVIGLRKNAKMCFYWMISKYSLKANHQWNNLASESK